MRCLLLALVLIALPACGGARLGTFYAEPSGDFSEPSGETNPAGESVEQEAYATVLSLFDYIAPDSEPDRTVDGRPFYYVYVWLPQAVPELGVRMVSPVRRLATPGSDDVTTAAWEANQQDDATFFDTFITFERTAERSSFDRSRENADITVPADVLQAHTREWEVVASNDDSDEMPVQPSGEPHNSLLRITNRRELTVGLIRIGITDHKNAVVQGSYLLQVGIRDELDGAMMARTPEELYEKLQAAGMTTN